MVNSTKLTVSKLSKLQRLIIHRLIDRGGWEELSQIAYMVAYEFEPRLDEKTKDEIKSNHLAKLMILLEKPDILAILGKPDMEEPYERNFIVSQITDGEVLSNNFKAFFYRAVKRLKERNIVRTDWYRIRRGDEESKWKRALELTADSIEMFQGCINLYKDTL